MPADTEVKAELDLGPPSQELVEWSQKNINEDPDKVYQDLEDFKNMIFTRGECTPHRIDDAFLLRFLRSRKFNLESAHRLIVNYYDFKEENSHLMEGIGFEQLERAGENDLISVPPYRDQTGKRILLYKLSNWDPEKFSVDDVFSATWMILELSILESSGQMLGGICIVDCANMTMHHALHLTPAVAHKLMQLCVTSHPQRLEALHFLNNSWIFQQLFNAFKPMLHEKMKSKLFVHGSDMESLHKYVDPKCLPEIYGGTHPNYGYRDWVDWFRKNETVCKELHSAGYNT